MPQRLCAIHSVAGNRSSISFTCGADGPENEYGAQDYYDEVKEKLVGAMKQLKSGDPRQEDTFIGPLISQKEAQRVESWVADALSKGESTPAKGPDGLAYRMTTSL